MLQSNPKGDARVRAIRASSGKHVSGHKVSGLKSKIWRMDIGHYGGMYVEIPEEYFSEFRGMFPRQEFPRRIRTLDVKKEFTLEGQQRFRSKFPKCSGVIKQIYFADRSNGLKRLDAMDLPYHELSNR